MVKTIYVVDDNETNLAAAEEALQEHYRVLTMISAQKMFALLDKVKPDLILLDIEMPDTDGFEALRRLKTKERYANIPIIFLTSMTDAELEVRGFQLGAMDFIPKHTSAPVLLNRIKTHLQVDEIIVERTAQIQRLKNAIVFSFADIVEQRDMNTGGHIERTSQYIEILVNALIARGVYDDDLLNTNLDSLISSSRLHDVGKVAIPDGILNKPGKLNDDEYEIMKTHAAKGVEIIAQIASRADDDVFLHNAKLFAGYHHERWDGKGYPYGLKGTEIPLQGRIMAIVDVYDALVSERPYKPPFSEERAIALIMQGGGSQFDPIISDVFYEVREQFMEVTQRCKELAAQAQ
ncbi:MAG: response regulator [Coriobacteriia bacterium]|nr:response regulator [Coriobacteriia bacterium]